MKKSNAIKMLAAGAALSIGLAFSAGAGMTAFAAEPTAEEFYSAGAAIRVIETGSYENGIRFDMLMSKEYYEVNNIAEAKTGVLVVPERLIVGAELDLADDVKGSEQGGLAADKDLTGMWSAEDGEDLYRNHAYLYNLPDTVYDDDIAFRGYVTVDGVTTYTETVVRSMSQVALAAITEDPSLEESIGGYLYDYDVTFSGAEVAAQTVRYGSKATEPETDPVKARNHFTGWFTSAELTEEYDFADPVYGDTVIYAGFEPHSYTEGVCSCGETLNDNTIISDEAEVAYVEASDSWNLTGETVQNATGIVCYTIAKEKLEAVKAEGYIRLGMTVAPKIDDGEQAVFTLYNGDSTAAADRIASTGSTIGTAEVSIDLTEETLEDAVFTVAYVDRTGWNENGCTGVNVKLKGFDADNISTWYTTDDESSYTVVEGGAQFSFTGASPNVQYGVTLTGTAVQYFIEQGYEALRFDITSSHNTETYLNDWAANAYYYPIGTYGNVTFSNLENFVTSGLNLHFVVYHCAPTATVTVKLSEGVAFDPEDISTWFFAKDEDVTFTKAPSGGVNIDLGDLPLATSDGLGGPETPFIYMRKDALDYLNGQGYTSLKFTLNSVETAAGEYENSQAGLYLGSDATIPIVAGGTCGLAGGYGAVSGTITMEQLATKQGAYYFVSFMTWYRNHSTVNPATGICIESIEGITEAVS